MRQEWINNKGNLMMLMFVCLRACCAEEVEVMAKVALKRRPEPRDGYEMQPVSARLSVPCLTQFVFQELGFPTFRPPPPQLLLNTLPT